MPATSALREGRGRRKGFLTGAALQERRLTRRGRWPLRWPERGQLLWLWPLLLRWWEEPLCPEGPEARSPSCFPGSSAASPKELEAWRLSLWAPLSAVSRAEGFKGADSLLDGGRSPQGWPRGAPWRWGSAGRRWPSLAWSLEPRFLKPFRKLWRNQAGLGGLLEDPSSRCFHPAACKLGTATGGVQLRGSPIWVAPHPIFLAAGRSGLQRHVVVVLTHDGAKEILMQSEILTQGSSAGLKAIVHRACLLSNGCFTGDVSSLGGQKEGQSCVLHLIVGFFLLSSTFKDEQQGF